MSQTATAAVLGLCRIRHEDPDAKARRHPQPILTDCCFPRSVPPEPITLKVSFDVPGVGGRPPHPLSRPFGSASVSWVGAPLLPAGPNEGGVAAVFRGPGVQATTRVVPAVAGFSTPTAPTPTRRFTEPPPRTRRRPDATELN